MAHVGLAFFGACCGVLATFTMCSPNASAAPQAVLQLGDAAKAVGQLQADLAQLGYLPVTVTHHTFVALYPDTPAPLLQLWHPNLYTTLTEGAVMAFEAQNQLVVDGIAGPQVWRALQRDLALDRPNALGYTYVQVSEQQPETLSIWHNGHMVLKSLTNTGVASAPTALGTWPVYLRYRTQRMSGKTPWGTYYSDPGVPYVNYFNGGDAIHGFTRSRYGFPQSLGCVELPIAAAASAWQWIHYGTLVTVSS